MKFTYILRYILYKVEILNKVSFVINTLLPPFRESVCWSVGVLHARRISASSLSKRRPRSLSSRAPKRWKSEGAKSRTSTWFVFLFDRNLPVCCFDFSVHTHRSELIVAPYSRIPLTGFFTVLEDVGHGLTRRSLHLEFVLPHLPCSPELAPSDFRCFGFLNLNYEDTVLWGNDELKCSRREEFRHFSK